MDFLPDGTLYLEDPAALKIPETSDRLWGHGDAAGTGIGQAAADARHELGLHR
jgi:hypothetical protein